MDSKNEFEFVGNTHYSGVEQLNNHIQTLQDSLVSFFVKLPSNPIDYQTCEKLKNNIQTLQISLDSYLSWLKMSNDNNIPLNTYRRFLYEKFNKSPEEAVIDFCDNLRFLVNSISIFEDLIKYNNLQAVLSSSFESDLPMEARKEIAISLQTVTTRLLQEGVSSEFLMQNETNSNHIESNKKSSCSIADIVYKKIKDGIRIDGVDAEGDIVLPDFIDGFPVVRIGENAFTKQQNITSIVLPEYLKTIEKNAFSFLNIASIIIPNNVETIGEEAFYSCKNLEIVSLSTKLKHIKSSAFEKCESLTNIVIPSGTTYIGDCAFYNCKNLRGIQIPATVSRIGYSCIPKKAIIYCGTGSRAERYVKENYGFVKKPYDSYNFDFHTNN